MPNVTSDGEGKDGCSSKGAPSTCCQPADGKGSPCCNPPGGSWGKGKALLAAVIIIAAIAVGANSIKRGIATQSVASQPASSCATPCGPASCANSPVGGASSQSEASKPASSCQTPSPCDAASGQSQGANR